MEKLVAHTLSAPTPGPHLLVFGAIHGEEPCGTMALQRFVAENHALVRGTLTLIPVCNPEALRLGKLFIDVNLNRAFRPMSDPQRYEEKLAQQLIPYTDRADYLLDLHSFTGAGTPYLFLDYDTPDSRSFAAMLGIDQWVIGWPELYAARPDLNSDDPVGYVARRGKSAVLVECGQHRDPAAPDVAYACLRRALHGLGMLDWPAARRASGAPVKYARITDVVICDRPGRFAKAWKNFDPVHLGDAVIVYDDGQILTAPYDGYVLLPRHTAVLGDEWIYFARDGR